MEENENVKRELKSAEKAEAKEEARPAEKVEAKEETKSAEETEASTKKKEPGKVRSAFREKREGLKYKLGAVSEKTVDRVKLGLRLTGALLVVGTLGVICGVTTYTKVKEKHAAKGKMISISALSEGVDPFYGTTFSEQGFSYEQMKVGIRIFDNIEPTNEELQDQALAELLARYDAEKETLEPQKPDPEQTQEYEVVDVEERVAYLKKLEEERAAAAAAAAAFDPSSFTASSGRGTHYTFAEDGVTYEELGTFVLTAYCPCPICCGIYSNMEHPTTASGAIAVEGVTIATDTSVIPFGTKVRIGDHIYTAQDRGGAIKGNRIDVFFNDHDVATNFGRQTMVVYKVVE